MIFRNLLELSETASVYSKEGIFKMLALRVWLLTLGCVLEFATGRHRRWAARAKAHRRSTDV
jgi:hypothetical protein